MVYKHSGGTDLHYSREDMRREADDWQHGILHFDRMFRGMGPDTCCVRKHGLTHSQSWGHIPVDNLRMDFHCSQTGRYKILHRSARGKLHLHHMETVHKVKGVQEWLDELEKNENEDKRRIYK